MIRLLARRLRATAASQVGVRGFGAACGVAAPLLVLTLGAPALPVARLALLLVIVAAALGAARAEPAGLPVVLSAQAFFLVTAPQSVSSPFPLLAAVLILGQAMCVVTSATAPHTAALDPVLIRRWGLRWGLLSLVAAFTAGAAALSPSAGAAELTPVARTALAVGAVVALGVLAIVLFTRSERDAEA